MSGGSINDDGGDGRGEERMNGQRKSNRNYTIADADKTTYEPPNEYRNCYYGTYPISDIFVNPFAYFYTAKNS